MNLKGNFFLGRPVQIMFAALIKVTMRQKMNHIGENLKLNPSCMTTATIHAKLARNSVRAPTEGNFIVPPSLKFHL